MHAPSLMRRSASPRLVAPHTNGTVNAELVDVVGLVGRGEHFALVDVVDAERLQDLGLDEVTDARLGHDRDGDRGLDALDHLGVAHAGHATVAADVGRHTLERHDGAGAGVLGDLGLLGGDDVHDDAALQHLGEATLDLVRARGARRGRLLTHVVQRIATDLLPTSANSGPAGGPVGSDHVSKVPARASSTHVRPGVSRIGLPPSSVRMIGE